MNDWMNDLDKMETVRAAHLHMSTTIPFDPSYVIGGLPRRAPVNAHYSCRWTHRQGMLGRRRGDRNIVPIE